MTQFHVTGLPTDWQPVLPFTEPIGLKFDERVNVFVGPNAVGKSTILRELLRHRGNLQRGTEFHTELIDESLPPFPRGSIRRSHNPTNEPTQSDMSHAFRPQIGGPLPALLSSVDARQVHVPHLYDPSVDINGEFATFRHTDTEGSRYWQNEPCWVYVPAIRSNFHQSAEVANLQDLTQKAYETIRSTRHSVAFHDGATIMEYDIRGAGEQDPSLLEPQSAEEIFLSIAHTIMYGQNRPGRSDNDIIRREDFVYDPINLYNTIQFIEGAIAFGQKVSIGLARVPSVAQLCAQEICSEVLAQDSGLQDLIVNTQSGRSMLAHTMGIQSQYTHEGKVFAGHLSAGTQGTLLWVWHLSMVMALNHLTARWGYHPCVLVIDEIENHLHPTWQRRVIPTLLKLFPRLQIFATTHSPFVIAGLKAGQVHLLNRDANGVVTASTNTEDIIGWTADEILRVFMGVDDPTDDATAAAARELRQLRDAGPHPDEREEERRQARMQELRQLVNRELLAGSVRAAEEERFAENLARILENYRLSKDLNQENG